MAEEVKYNNTLVSGRADETLSYTRYIKDESSGKSTKELLDEKVNKTDQLGTTQIADNAVTTEKLENESVTTDKLDAASVTTDKVADANITTSKLADSSVESEKINNKAVTTDKLNDGAVDNSKLSPNSVTSEKIKNESIITEKLNDRAVTTEKVEEKAITNSKLGDQSVDGRVVREASLESKHFANESVTTEKVARKSITKDKLADNSVDDSKVVDGSIGNAKLSPESVTTEKIKDGSVTNEKVADDTLGIEKFDPELRKTIQAATGLPEDLSQMIQDVDKSVKQLHEKDKNLQSQVDDKQQQITTNKAAQDAKNASLDENMTKLNTRDDQITETLKNISATGGASVASAVTYDNTTSQLTSANIQGAVDELQGSKVDKASIVQESGEAEDKVMSQKAVSDKLSNLREKTHYINGLDCAKELYIFNNEVGIKDLHLAYRNHNNTWYLVFFNDSKSVAQTDVYKEEIGGIIPIYKLENGSLAEVIGYIDVDWSALKEGATAIVKELLPPAFDMYSNPNILNLMQDYDSSYVAKNLLTPDSFSQVTQFATWNLDADIWKLASYKATGNALYKSFERDNPLLKAGHVFYFCENMKSNAGCRFIAQIDSSNNSVCIHSGSGEYEFMSNILKINYSGGGNNLLVVAARLMEPVSVVEVKDFMMIDLTDIFGRNNEPSKEYMDFLFKMRMPTFYGEKKIFSSENFAAKELCDKVNDLIVSSNNMVQGRITGDMFKEGNKNILINALNESIGDFVKINKTNDVCVRYVKLDDDTHEIYSKINYSLRKKNPF